MNQDTGEIKPLGDWKELLGPEKTELLIKEKKLVLFDIGEVICIKGCYFEIVWFRRDFNRITLKGIPKDQGEFRIKQQSL